MSEVKSAAETAVEKLEAFVNSLSADEQAELAPLIAGGMERAYEDAQGEVSGHAMNMQFQPAFLNFVSQSRTPGVLGLGGTKFFPPMPMPM